MVVYDGRVIACDELSRARNNASQLMQTSVDVAEGVPEVQDRSHDHDWLRVRLYGYVLTFPGPRSLTVFSRQETNFREV